MHVRCESNKVRTHWEPLDHLNASQLIINSHQGNKKMSNFIWPGKHLQSWRLPWKIQWVD